MSKHTYGTTNQTPEWGKHPPDDWQVVEEALERLYINVRSEYPFSVRDKELVESGLARLREREAQLTEKYEKEGNLAVDEGVRRFKAEARVAELEEALREIAVGYQDVLSGPDVDRIMALAHKEETP